MGESSLIVQRDARDRDNDTLAWMVATDARALGMADCGCGLPKIYETIRYGKPAGAKEPVVVELIFFHDGALRCQLAFDCKDGYKPLTYGQYCKLMEIESDEEDDG